MTASFVLVCAATLVGSAVQRATGMGFALVAAPFLVVALGPVDGVVVANVAGAVAAAFVVVAAWRDLDRSRTWWLILTGIAGSVPGALIVWWLPPDVIGLVVAALVLVALLLTVRAPAGRMRDTAAVRSVVGTSCGFLGTAAGVGGPPLAIYMRGVAWPRASFAAGASAVFVVQSTFAVLLKGAYPDFGVAQWGWVLAMVLLGVPVGSWLNRRMSDRLAMRVVLAMAFIGTGLALARGVTALTG